MVPPDPQQGSAVRRRIAAFGRAAGIDEDELCDLLIAVGEALANAIEHSGTNEPIEVSAWLSGGSLVARVVDRGAGFVPREPAFAPLPPGEVLAERGRGLFIMAGFSDAIAVESGPGRGTSVTLTHRLRAPIVA
jgi:serine/threonine-protein kinase RsbW